MVVRRLPPPTFVLQRLRGATIAALALKYGVSRHIAREWQWDVMRSKRKYIQPIGLCRILAQHLVEERPLTRLSGARWFAEGVLNALRQLDDVPAANRDHAYAMLKGGHLMMTHPPSTS